MTQVIINNFSGGIVNDPRNPRNGIARVITYFDIYTNPKRMTPYRRSVDGDSSSTDNQIQNFEIAVRTGTTNSLFGLGTQTASTTRAEIFYKNLGVGIDANDLDDAVWTETGNNTAGQNTTAFSLFVHYARTALIYGAQTGSHIWTYDPTGGGFTDTHRALVYTSIGQGLVFSNDILYIPYRDSAGPTSAIASNNNGTWNNTALTLPRAFTPGALVEFNNYLAIACASISTHGGSRVFLWDTSSDSWNEQIDWGEGALNVLGEVDGVLIGISIVTDTIASVQTPKIVFRALVGGKAVKFLELISLTSGTNALSFGRKKNNRLHFQMQVVLNGLQKEGIWSIGRASPTSPFTLVHERTPNNTTALSSGSLSGFIYVQDFLFQSYITSAARAMSKTDDQETYTDNNSIWESQMNLGMNEADKLKRKQIRAVSVHYDPLPDDGQVILQLKVDGGSNTTIFTETTNNALVTENVDKTLLGTEGREFEFRIQSSGGAIVTALKYDYDIIKTQI